MNKLSILLICFSFSLSTNAQCDASELSKRPFDKYKNANDKIANIRLTIQNNEGIIQVMSNKMTRLQSHIKTSLQNSKKPNIDMYISDLESLFKDFSTFKIGETKKLDEMIYCLLIFLKTKYYKIQTILSYNDKIADLATKISEIYSQIESEGTPRLIVIDNEIKLLKSKY